ncbi:hypothetical protein AMTR_s00100p00072190 [Amborella trichopoda]|uniref:Uncharacterized protein n=1 Tax=Amborella trichopoda TaxID=13333 RepID=W1NYN8_AMBTC|nr:hypothetical protein AMTR_s00100p00072190 [Amborella trichopoda]
MATCLQTTASQQQNSHRRPIQQRRDAYEDFTMVILSNPERVLTCASPALCEIRELPQGNPPCEVHGYTFAASLGTMSIIPTVEETSTYPIAGWLYVPSSMRTKEVLNVYQTLSN